MTESPAPRAAPSRPLSEFAVSPDPHDSRLTRAVTGVDHTGAEHAARVVTERPLTIFLNRQEIVTAMTIGNHPEELALGYLLNQGMLRPDDVVTGADYEDDIDTIVIRTARQTDYEDKLRKKTQTSGCAVGTVFGDMMEALDALVLPDHEVRASWLYALQRKLNTRPSLYLEAGAIHGCALCRQDAPLIYVEDVGRHNAVDKIAGMMWRDQITPDDKIFYTTGRLTSEMVVKCARMGVPVLASRSGFTAWGVELAQQIGLTLIGRMRGKRFLCLSGAERLVFDVDANAAADEPETAKRRGTRDD